MSLRSPQLLILLALFSSSASAEDLALIVKKNFKEEIQIGGIFRLFRVEKDSKIRSLELSPKSGSMTVLSVSLDSGQCKFAGVSLPNLISEGKGLEILPDCDVSQAEVTTDKGTYRFTFR